MKDVGQLAVQHCESTVDGGPGAPERAPAEDQVQELTLALAARDRFLSLIGHELRNTLAPMVLLAEQFGMLAEGSQPPGKVLSRVAMLTNNLNKLMATIGRIVEVADLRRGKVPLAPSTTNLVEVVGDVCVEVAREAAAGGCDLVIEASEPVVGLWDRARVKQIAANLVVNAIRYGGGGRVEIAVRNGDGNGELAVRDHGPGIDEALVPHLFGFFENASRRPGGLGLGLWVVQTLCTAMGGAVSVENCSDGGARFCVVLPRG
ncbi:MAG TPA: HAMP domain-containing sensor histidine kinase [Kofleriaceae bacterium]|nr:HAMP domain-containing sensor histidine kinase [Kofleriaceae bacterium]